MLVWMDLEMTGLDHTSDVIVEIATLITDDELNVVAEGPDLVVHQPEEVLVRMDPFVVDMHTRSGLLDLIRGSTLTLEEAGRATLEFIREHVPEAR
ncbi:MAG TPA: oligoribonuclease, partial [Ilumatobacter sp.]|nr:oligoribonuclease [Ilumatobacter sp.]